jgi:hypothetical protein
METDTDIIGEHLDLDYGRDRGYVAVGSNFPGGERSTFEVQYFKWPTERQACIDYLVHTNQQGRRVWAPTSLLLGKRNSDDNCIGSRVLSFEVDQPLDDNAWDLLAQLDAMVVESGTPEHYHVRVYVDRPLVWYENKKWAEAIAHTCGVTGSTESGGKWGPAAFLGVVGTQNTKPGAQMVRVKRRGGSTTLEALRRLVTPGRTSRDTYVGDDVLDAQEVHYDAIPGHVLGRYSAGHMGGSRYPQVAQLIGFAISSGLTDGEILWLLTTGPDGNGFAPAVNKAQDEGQNLERYVTREIRRTRMAQTKAESKQSPTTNHTNPLFFALEPWDMIDNGIPGVVWHGAPGLFVSGCMNYVNADSEAGKSGMSLDLSVHMTLGIDITGLELPNPDSDELRSDVRLLYLDYENPPQIVMNRFRLIGHRFTEVDGYFYRAFPQIAPLNTSKGAGQVLEFIDAAEINFLVCDSLSKIVEGDPNQDATYTTLATHLLNPLRERTVTGLFLDNFGHFDKTRARGSSAKKDNMDFGWNLEMGKRGRKGVTRGVLKEAKNRNGSLPEFVNVTRFGKPQDRLEHKFAILPAFSDDYTTPSDESTKDKARRLVRSSPLLEWCGRASVCELVLCVHEVRGS